MSLHYIKELKSDDPGYIMFKKNHWVASDTTYHNGFLNITVIDKVTGQNAEIEQIYLSNSKLGDVIKNDSCIYKLNIPIKNNEFCMLNIKLCSEKQWIVD